MKLGLYALAALCLTGVATGRAGAETVYAIDNTNFGESGVVSLDNSLNYQGVFQTSATPLNGLAVNGGDIYASSGTSITEYDTSGNVLNTFNAFDPGNFFYGLSASGSSVYAIDNTNFGESGVISLDNNLNYQGVFQTSATPLNGLVVHGGDIYASSGTSITEYDASGNVLNTFNAFDPGNFFYALAFWGSNVYAIDNTNFGESGVISLDSNLNYQGVFQTSATPLNGLAANGGDLYASSGTSITEYDASGNVLNTFNAFDPGNFFYDIGVTGTPAPEPASVALVIVALLALVLRRGFRKSLNPTATGN